MTASCDQLVTITDAQAPAITCSADVSINNDLDECGALVTLIAPATSDNCTVSSTVAVRSDALALTDLYPVGVTTVTWTVTDQAGLTASCDQLVTITDAQAPAITCTLDVAQTADVGLCDAAVTIAPLVNGDNCGILSVVNDYNNTADASGTYPVGTTTVTWTVTDIYNNVTTCSFDVTVTDDEAPVITCPSDITVSNDEDVCGAAVTWTPPTGDDNCTFTTIQTAGLAPGSEFPVGTTVITYEVTDASGNSSSCSFNVTVEDTQAPVITCPSDITVSCDQTDPIYTGVATAEDDCDVTFTHSDEWIIPPPPPANGSCICDGGMVTLTVKYNGPSGVIVDVYYDIGVLLKTFTNVNNGQSLTVAATEIGQTKFKSDTRFRVNGGPETKIHTSCSKYILGRVINEFTVIGWTDGSGNTCDETVPQILSCDCDGGMIELSVEYNGPAGATVTAEYDPGNSLGTFTNVQPGDIITVISWSINQNKLKKDTKFFVNGNESKFHTSCSKDLLDLTIGAFTVIGWLDGDGQICGFSPQEDNTGATIIRTWTATDTSGNSSSCVQTITIEEDTTPPVIFCPADEIIACDEDSSPANTGFATASDTCSEVTIAFNDVVTPLPPQPGFSCSCDGGMVTLTVEYNGPANATVDVFYDTGIPLATFTGVNNGDWLTVDATSVGQAKFKSDTRFRVNNGPETKIHTSCSKYILGRVVNEFTVIGWTDGSGNTCDQTVPPIFSCECDHGIIELSVRYNGDDGAVVTAQLDGSNSLGTFNVDDGDTITVISWTANQNKLKKDTKFYVDGQESKFHTSCSKDILDLKIGAFTVVGWLDGDGQICGFSPAGDEACNTLIERTWTASDASGNTSTCIQTITVTTDGFNLRVASVNRSITPEKVVGAELRIFPNPASEQLNIVFSSYEKKTVMFFDQSGKMVYDQRINEGVQFHQVNTSEFASGVYFVQIHSDENGIIREKFILSH